MFSSSGSIGIGRSLLQQQPQQPQQQHVEELRPIPNFRHVARKLHEQQQQQSPQHHAAAIFSHSEMTPTASSTGSSSTAASSRFAAEYGFMPSLQHSRNTSDSGVDSVTHDDNDNDRVAAADDEALPVEDDIADHPEDSRTWEALRDYVYTSHPARLLSLLQCSPRPVETFFSVLRVSQLLGLSGGGGSGGNARPTDTVQSSIATTSSKKSSSGGHYQQQQSPVPLQPHPPAPKHSTVFMSLPKRIRQAATTSNALKQRRESASSPPAQQLHTSLSAPQLFSHSTGGNRRPRQQDAGRLTEIEDVLVLWAVPYAHLILKHRQWRHPLVTLDFCSRFHAEVVRRRGQHELAAGNKQDHQQQQQQQQSNKSGRLSFLAKLRRASASSVRHEPQPNGAAVHRHQLEVSESYWVMAMFWYTHGITISENESRGFQLHVQVASDESANDEADCDELTVGDGCNSHHVMHWLRDNIQWQAVDRDELVQQWSRHSSEERRLSKLMREGEQLPTMPVRFSSFPLRSEWLQFVVAQLNLAQSSTLGKSEK